MAQLVMKQYLAGEGRAIILSLRPQFAKAIYSKTKHFEFRRRSVRLRRGDLVLIYETAPVAKVTGVFLAGEVTYGRSKILLREETDAASRRAAAKYLAGANICSAIEILKPKAWRVAVSLSVFGVRRAPQSYCYFHGILRRSQMC